MRGRGGPLTTHCSRAKLVEGDWVQVVREAVGFEGHLVPQLDLVVYGDGRGGALGCDATLVSQLMREGEPHRHPRTASEDGAPSRSQSGGSGRRARSFAVQACAHW